MCLQGKRTTSDQEHVSAIQDGTGTCWKGPGSRRKRCRRKAGRSTVWTRVGGRVGTDRELVAWFEATVVTGSSGV